MTLDQLELCIVLICTILLFLIGRWRHDIVAVLSLLSCVLLGLIPADEAFLGFGHPAVITVACVLIISWGLQSTGVVSFLSEKVLPKSTGATTGITVLVSLGALLSAFMNNVGAMALLMPIAIQLAAKNDMAPGKVLMPLAFGTILGGMTTLIGTPPNLIVSSFRLETGAASFAMFDFAAVGVPVAFTGIFFVAFLGWRLIPVRKQEDFKGFNTDNYLTEIRISETSGAVNKTLREVDLVLEQSDAQIIGLVRNDLRLSAPGPQRTLRAGDILVIEADPNNLSSVLSSLGLELEEAVPPSNENEAQEEQKQEDGKKNKSPEIELQEVVVMPYSEMIGRSPSDIKMRDRHALNLLAISRHGRQSIKRLRSTRIQAGDVLLLQGFGEALLEFENRFNCVPLAQRSIHIPNKGRAIIALVIMILAITGAAFGLLPAAITFAAGTLFFILLKIIPVRRVYEAVDWSVIVLLGALIPIATALASTGTADLLTRSLLENVIQGNSVVALALVLIITMTLSDFMNNTATAAMMCPIAISAALHLGVNADTFLMAVAIGASCAFLTPIGHQNNTLILGPGGFRFSDYWKLGLPLELLVIGVSMPMLLIMWPL